MSTPWNLHDAVRGAIQAVNPDVQGTVYLSTGRTNVRGILTPTYSPVTAMLQVQAKAHDRVRHERGLEYDSDFFSIYAYGEFNDLERPDGEGGDVVTFGGKWYYISQITEWWPSWCAFEVVRQLNATDIATLLASLANGENPPA